MLFHSITYVENRIKTLIYDAFCLFPNQMRDQSLQPVMCVHLEFSAEHVTSHDSSWSHC